jgi:hypothetical protein
MGLRVTTILDGTTIIRIVSEIRVNNGCFDVLQELNRTRIDTKNRHFRNCMLKLGWTPPKEHNSKAKVISKGIFHE